LRLVQSLHPVPQSKSLGLLFGWQQMRTALSSGGQLSEIAMWAMLKTGCI
jgi:hypothetical protein